MWVGFLLACIKLRERLRGGSDYSREAQKTFWHTYDGFWNPPSLVLNIPVGQDLESEEETQEFLEDLEDHMNECEEEP